MSVTAFVTGGTGFLGQRLVRSLLVRGMSVRCLIRETSDVNGLMSGLDSSQKSRLHFVSGSLNDSDAISQHLSGVNVVYHLAAALGGSCSTMFLNTVIPTRRFMETAATAGIDRFVLISSMGVYGTEKLCRGGTLDETTPVDPHPEQRDPYTFSKIRQEEIAWQIRERCGLPLVVIRPGVIYGPGRSLLTSRVGLSVGPLFLRMGGSHRLPYVYVDNCAEAIALAGIAPNVEGEIFNLVDDNLPSGNQIIRTLRKHGRQIRSLWIPQRLITPLASVYHAYSQWSEGQLPPVLSRYKCDAIWKPLQYSNSRAKRSLNWVPEISTEEGLQRAIVG